MSSRLRFPSAAVFLPGLVALCGLPVLASVLWYWGHGSEFVDRFLILLASAWLLARCWRGHGTAPHAPAPIGFTAIVLAGLALPPACYLLVQVGPRPVLLWWLTAGWLMACGGVVLILRGWRSLRDVLFPLMFLLFALPVPERFERPLQNILQECTTRCAAGLLSLAGVAVQRHGFVLELPSGDLGVVEACSGIRSVTALTAIAAFLAYWRGLGLLRGALFVLTAFPVIVIGNAARVTVSGLLQENVGPQAIRGTAHELLGFATVLLGLAVLVGLSRLVRGRCGGVAHVSDSCASDLPARPHSARPAALGAWLLAVTLAASVAAAVVGLRSGERQHETLPLEQVALQLDGWRGEEVPIPESLREMLTYDRATHRVYRNAIGQEIHVWVLFWSGASSVRGYHHPDVCWPNRGWTLTRSGVEDVRLDGNTSVPLTIREFERDGRRQVVCYWTQEGSRVWTAEDERAALAEGTPGHQWIVDRLSGTPTQQSGRMTVLLGGDVWDKSGYGERSITGFSKSFAGELFHAAPWARPQQTPSGN